MKILLAVDGSTYSDDAVKEVASRPWPKGSEVRVICVVEPAPPPTPETWGLAMESYLIEMNEWARKHAQTAVEEAAKILRLDEPTVGMDPVKQLHETYGMTIFLTTHYMEEADHLCGRVAIMHANKLAALGTPGELKLGVGGEKTKLDDVLIHYSGGVLEAGDDYSGASRERLTTSGLG